MNEKKLAQSAVRDVQRITASRLVKPPLMPWERQPFAGVFRPESFLSNQISFDSCDVGLSEALSASTSSSLSHALEEPPILKHAAKRRRISECIISSDDMRQRSLALFRVVLQSNPSATELGKQLSLAWNSDRMELFWSTLEDTFAAKSSATVYKRSRSLWQYFVWLKVSRRSDVVLFSELLAYEYLLHARERNKSPSHGIAFLQCLNFLHSTCKFVEFSPSELTGRVRGSCRAMLSNKKPLQQARALYRDEVAALERFILEDKHEPRLRIICGYLLFCLLSCSRFSDPMYAVGWTITSSSSITLLEAGTRYHKTSHVRNRQETLLPLVALGHVFTDRNWAEVWMSLREKHLGDYPFALPGFSETSGRWLSRPMIASEGALWLRDIVCFYYATGDTLTTHGLKATLLTWSTISGILTFDQRRAMGHHIDPGSRAPLCYSRDNTVQLQARIAFMLRRVASGMFDPDLPRAAQVEAQLDTLLDVIGSHDEQPPPDNVDPGDEAVECASEGSEVCTAEDIEVQADDADIDEVRVDAEKAAGLILQHKASGVLHVQASPDKFTCGRSVSAAYSVLLNDLVVGWPLCRQCRQCAGDDLLQHLLL